MFLIIGHIFHDKCRVILIDVYRLVCGDGYVDGVHVIATGRNMCWSLDNAPGCVGIIAGCVCLPGSISVDLNNDQTEHNALNSVIRIKSINHSLIDFRNDIQLLV